MNGSTSDLLNDLRKIDERAKKFFGLEKGIHPSETAIQAVILVATFMFLHNYMFNMGTKAIHVACWPFFQSPPFKFRSAKYVAKKFIKEIGVVFAPPTRAHTTSFLLPKTDE
jgi:hypothetical protein